MNKKFRTFVVIGSCLSLLVVSAVLIATTRKKIVACIGDSITFGRGVEETRNVESYPSFLNDFLGRKYLVKNFGRNGATALKKSSKPYVEQKEYKESLKRKANVYIVMLGTNDTRPINWNGCDGPNNFQKDYINLIETYKNRSKNAQFLLIQPPKSFRSMTPMTDQTVNNDLIKTSISSNILKAGERLNLPVIDLYGFTENHPEWFPDGLHPNAIGNKKIAEYIYKTAKALTNLW